MTGQLPLPFDPEPSLTADDFIPGAGSRPALAWLERTAAWPAGRLALWGGAGSGKTHLLRIWAARMGAQWGAGAGWPEADWPEGPLAIDDADGLDPAHLLYALNAAAEAGQPVLLAARAPPGRWGTVLPDLASRLRATTAVGLGPADDAFLQHLLVRLLSDRQLTVPDTVQAWMLTALPRDPAVLRQAVLTLDRAALASGRAVTRPLATAVLGPLVRDSSDIITADASPEPAGLL